MPAVKPPNNRNTVKAAPTRVANTRSNANKRPEKPKPAGKIDKAHDPSHVESEKTDTPSQPSEANKTPKTVSLLSIFIVLH